MSREEFMKKLAYLLSDISEEEREDALLYYEDYFDEAGEEKEEEVIRELGSPERVASIIRHSAQGISDGGSFTETGFEDERFRDPNFELAKRLDLPDVVEQSQKDAEHTEKREHTNRTDRRSRGEGAEDNPFAGFGEFEEADRDFDGEKEFTFEEAEKGTRKRRSGRSGSDRREEKRGKPWTNSWLKLVLLLILVGRAWDMLKVLFDLGVGIAGVLVFCLVLAGVAVVGCFAMMIVFFALAAWNVLEPITLMFYGGMGIVSLGLMCLSLVLAVKVYGSWIPYLARKVYRLCHRIWEGLWSGRRAEG